MGVHSAIHLQMQEEHALLEADRITEGGIPSLSLNEIEELFQAEPIQIPAFVPYMERHAAMLEERNMLIDLSNYSLKISKASLNHKNFWLQKYDDQVSRLACIESQLLEVESAAS